MLFFPFSFHAHVELKRADKFFLIFLFCEKKTWGVTTQQGKLNIPKDLLIGRGQKFKAKGCCFERIRSGRLRS